MRAPLLARFNQAMHSAFSEITFHDAPAAAARLEAILQSPREGLAEHLHVALMEAANADRVLVRLERFLESCGAERPVQLDLMAQEARFARLLCRILDYSHFLTDIVCRNPEYMTWLWVESEIDPAWSRPDLLAELRNYMKGFSSTASRRDAMRKFYRRDILRIGARDVFAHRPVAEITEDLANLADAMLQVAFEDGQREMSERYGEPIAESDGVATFVVLAMGKLGGRELNFSSDVDLIFVYSHDGQTSGRYKGEATGKTTSNAEYFIKLGEWVIKALADNTAEGHVFRVDMRLRPHGRMGPLAVSLGTAMDYFGSQARPWERQALIKARPCAGDIELGEWFIEQTRPIVYPRYFDDATLNEIRDTKMQMEAEVARRGETDIEVKLGRGGIRDIEFTVQMLQLLNGGQFPELRSPNTLAAIDGLARRHLLSPFEALTLQRNYNWLRHVEHRLQIEGSQQIHALPSDPAALDDFAGRLGFESGESFLRVYHERAGETRGILEQFLTTEGAGNLWVNELLTPSSVAAEGVARLARYGFADPAGAREELLDLCLGPDDRPHSATVRQKFREVAPALLEALRHVPNPDEALMHLSRMLMAVDKPASVYDLLRYHPALADALVLLIANSEFLTSFILRDPGLFEIVAEPQEHERTREELEDELQFLRRAINPEVALYRLRNGEMLRIGLADLRNRLDVLAVGRQLTQVADLCVDAALREARAAVAERHGPAEIPFAVLGYGKMGGREMGYGSDLDLVFVYGDNCATQLGMSPGEYTANIATTMIKCLKELTPQGNLYDVDTRLRPDGRRGPLTVSAQRYVTYYRDEAEAWERLALVKARFIAGDAAFAETLGRSIQEIVWDRPFTAADLDRVEDLRARLAAQHKPEDIKHGVGGIAELEFAVRLLQLAHAEQSPALRRGDVAGAIDTLESTGHLSADDAAALRQGYSLFRRVENRLRLREGRSLSTLPANPEEVAQLGERLGIGSLPSALSAARKEIHALYERALAGFTQTQG